MNQAVIGVGSNIDPQLNISMARTKIAENWRIVAESRFIETEPVGYAEQPNFINGTLLIETRTDRKALQRRLKIIERELGRERDGNRNGPRTIDLDLLVWNGRVVDEDVYARAFLREGIQQVLPQMNLARP